MRDCRLLAEGLGQIVPQDLSLGLLIHVDIGAEQNQETDKIATQQRNYTAPKLSI